MNNKSKRKFLEAVNRVGLHQATNGYIPAEIQKERHRTSPGRITYGLSYENLTQAELRVVKKIV